MGEAVRNTTTRARPLPTSRGPQTRHEPRAATDTPAGIQGASCHRERVAGRTRTARNLARALTDGVQRPPWFRNQTKRRTAKQELTSCRSGGRSAGTGAADLLTTRQPRGRGPRSGPATAATQTPTAAPSPRREDGHAGPEESRRATLSRGRRGRRSSEHSPGRNAVQSRATRSCAWARGDACPTHVVVRGLPRPPRLLCRARAWPRGEFSRPRRHEGEFSRPRRREAPRAAPGLSTPSAPSWISQEVGRAVRRGAARASAREALYRRRRPWRGPGRRPRALYIPPRPVNRLAARGRAGATREAS